MKTLVGVAPCDKCGRELITDEMLGGWYWQAGCSDVYGDGCDGHADETRVVERVEIIW
jgi:hypothetical protein